MSNKKAMPEGMTIRYFERTPPAREPEVEQIEPTTAEEQPEQPDLTQKPEQQQPKPRKRTKAPKVERLVTVNIKILESQQEWLTDTAKKVRQNNDTPVPAPERVYPQHLIQTAIELLQSSDVDWSQVRNIGELKKHLNL